MERTATLGIRAHGVGFNLRSDSRDLLAYTARLVPGLAGPPVGAPDFEVRAHWIEAALERDQSWFGENGEAASPGRHLRVVSDELVWLRAPRDRDLQLRFCRGGAGLLFEVACRYWPSPKKLAEHPDLKRKRFFDLLRYLVHFPIAWHLERNRGLSLLHASAVARGGRAVLVVGPGGAGKTTTCLALLARAGMSLVSENLLLCDGEAVYPVAEPIRLSEEGLALLGGDFAGLGPIALEGGLKHKRMFHLRDAGAGQGLPPEAIFFARFAERGFARRLAPELACEWLEATHRLTLELADYSGYASALELLWPRPGAARARLEVLERLTAATPCFVLGIDRSAGLAPVVDRILRCLDGGGREPGA